MLAILGELCWLQFFKTVYLETSNVRFGSFFQNPVTYDTHSTVCHLIKLTGHGIIPLRNWSFNFSAVTYKLYEGYILWNDNDDNDDDDNK